MTAPRRPIRPLVLVLAVAVVLVTAGVVLGAGGRHAPPAHDAPHATAARPAGAEAPDDPALGTRSTLGLQGEWLLLLVERTWLAARSAERERNTRRTAAVLRELNVRDS